MTTTEITEILDVPVDIERLLPEHRDYIPELAAEAPPVGIYRRYFAGVWSLCDRADLDYELSPIRRIDAPSGYRDYDIVADAEIGNIDDEPALRRRVRADMPVGLHITNSGRPDEYLLYESVRRRHAGLPEYGTITVWSAERTGEYTTFALREREWRLINRRILREIARDVLDQWCQEDNETS